MIEGQNAQERRIVTIFDDIYDLPDCHRYYQAMYNAGFRTAHHAVQGFREARTQLMAARGLERVNVVDFASGYGIAAALMRHDLTLDDVLARYQEPWVEESSAQELRASDRDWFVQRRRDEEADRYIGIDIAGNALDYGVAAGIFDAAYAENLQGEEPSDALTEELSCADLIVECGSVAHMLPKALDRMLEQAKGPKPWVITAPIRGNDTAEGFDVLAKHGLTTHPLGQPFRHRRFADPDEQARAIKNAEDRGHETEGFETTGYFHAQLYLSQLPDEQ